MTDLDGVAGILDVKFCAYFVFFSQVGRKVFLIIFGWVTLIFWAECLKSVSAGCCVGSFRLVRLVKRLMNLISLPKRKGFSFSFVSKELGINKVSIIVIHF